MSQVSRPMQIALLATVLVAVVWFVALRPKPAGSGASAAAPATPAQEAPSAPGAEGLKRAVDKAHGAVDTASADAQRAAGSSADATSTGGAAETAATSSGDTSTATPSPGATSTATPSATPTTAAGTTSRHAAPTHAAHHAATDPHVRMVRAALRQHKAVAIAFVDSKISDARAVAVEIAHVSHFGGRAVTLAVPLAQLSRYGFITRGVDVTVAPTTLIIARNHQATTIVGFADRFEIQQRLADALAVKR